MFSLIKLWDQNIVKNLPYIFPKLYKRQRYSIDYIKGHMAQMFYYLFIIYCFFKETLQMQGVVAKIPEGTHSIGNQKFKSSF